MFEHDAEKACQADVTLYYVRSYAHSFVPSERKETKRQEHSSFMMFMFMFNDDDDDRKRRKEIVKKEKAKHNQTLCLVINESQTDYALLKHKISWKTEFSKKKRLPSCLSLRPFLKEKNFMMKNPSWRMTLT
jgi:hypothetical protein